MIDPNLLMKRMLMEAAGPMLVVLMIFGSGFFAGWLTFGM